jgi:hypothetical protein
MGSNALWVFDCQKMPEALFGEKWNTKPSWVKFLSKWIVLDLGMVFLYYQLVKMQIWSLLYWVLKHLRVGILLRGIINLIRNHKHQGRLSKMVIESSQDTSQLEPSFIFYIILRQHL